MKTIKPSIVLQYECISNEESDSKIEGVFNFLFAKINADIQIENISILFFRNKGGEFVRIDTIDEPSDILTEHGNVVMIYLN